MCKHCEFLNKIFDKIDSNREYWLYTEMFVYLHGGADHCKPVKLDSKNHKTECQHCGSSNVYVGCLDCKKEG